MTKLKICGLRDIDNAVVAADAGADFLGFNFVPGARRRITQERGRFLITEYRRRRGAGGPRLVGLFADQPLDEVNRVSDFCGMHMVQLCGDESPEYWAKVDRPIIKQLKVRDQGPWANAVAETQSLVEEVAEHGHVASLDRYEPGALGGTGLSFDWSIAAQIARKQQFLLSGGLSPDNVVKAITVVEPWGVDVSSGVETDGVKDPQKIAAFAAEVSRADERTR